MNKYKIKIFSFDVTESSSFIENKLNKWFDDNNYIIENIKTVQQTVTYDRYKYMIFYTEKNEIKYES